jgi:hypothetical protein
LLFRRSDRLTACRNGRDSSVIVLAEHSARP